MPLEGIAALLLIVTTPICLVGAVHLLAPGWSTWVSRIAAHANPYFWIAAAVFFLLGLWLSTPAPPPSEIVFEIEPEGLRFGTSLEPWHAIGKIWIEEIRGDAETPATRLLKIQLFPWTPEGEPYRRTSWLQDLLSDGTRIYGFDKSTFDMRLEDVAAAIQAHRPKEAP